MDPSYVAVALVVVVVVAAVGVASAEASDFNSTTDGVALQAFKSELSDPNGKLNTWVLGSDPCNASAPWNGVTCANVTNPGPRVSSLDCYDFQLRGPVNAAALSNLVRFILFYFQNHSSETVHELFWLIN